MHNVKISTYKYDKGCSLCNRTLSVVEITFLHIKDQNQSCTVAICDVCRMDLAALLPMK